MLMTLDDKAKTISDVEINYIINYLASKGLENKYVITLMVDSD